MTVTEMTDNERLDWLEGDVSRLEDVRSCVNSEELTLREAIDYLASL